MKKKFENWLAMFIAVLTLLEKYSSNWQGLAAFASTVEKLKSNHSTIDLLRKKSGTGSKGVTLLKNELKDRLVAQTFGVAASMMAYFNKTNDTVLYHRIKTTRSDLLKLRSNQLITKVKDILDLGREKLPLLADYQVTEAQLNELESNMNLYESQSISPRLTIGERKTANDDLAALIKECNQILNDELDLMMIPFEKGVPVFYSEYQNARKVVDYGTRHEKDDDDDDAPTGDDTGDK